MKKSTFLAAVAALLMAAVLSPVQAQAPPQDPVALFKKTYIGAAEFIETALSGTEAQTLIQTSNQAVSFLQQTETEFAEAVGNNKPTSEIDRLIEQYVLGLENVRSKYMESAAFLRTQREAFDKIMRVLNGNRHISSITSEEAIEVAMRAKLATSKFADAHSESLAVINHVSLQVSERVKTRVESGETPTEKMILEELRNVAEAILNHKAADGVAH